MWSFLQLSEHKRKHSTVITDCPTIPQIAVVLTGKMLGCLPKVLYFVNPTSFGFVSEVDGKPGNKSQFLGRSADIVGGEDS